MKSPHSTPSSPLPRRDFLQLLGASAATVGLVGCASVPALSSSKTAAIKVTVLYGQPANPAAFERYYAETHLPIAGKMKGFTRLELSRGLPGPDGSKPAFYRMAEFWFESAAAMQTCLVSAEGLATAADLANFATGGVTLFASEVLG